MSGVKRCIVAFPDAGKPCTGKRDCKGRCLYDGRSFQPSGAKVTGRCEADNDPCGCFTDIDGGVVTKGTYCVD
jgi:hypothetical protein